MDNDVLHVFARGRDREYFRGDAQSLSSVNEKGVFDILPKHESFISVIFDYILIVKNNTETVKIPLTGKSVLRVYRNTVDVFMSLTRQ